jgi:hypothetical protein
MKIFGQAVVMASLVMGLGSFVGGKGLVGVAYATPADEVETAKRELTRQIDICKNLEIYVEDYSKPRLRIIRESSELTLEAIGRYGLGNMTTMNLYQMQIITYMYSERYFESIRTAATEDDITEILQIATKIKEDRGGPFLKITNQVFTNIEKHFRELRRLSEGRELAKKLDSMNIWAELGDVIASSAGGDSPNSSNCKAVKLFRRIKGLYPDFYAESASSPIFDACQSIIGLAEFYNEYAKADEAVCH